MTPWLRSRGTVVGATLAGLGFLAGCATPPPPAPTDPRTVCTTLALSVPATAIGVPSGGASLQSAQWIEATPAEALPAGGVLPASPAHCRVLMRVEPVAPAAPPVDLVVALPEAWNGRTLQFGDDGLDARLFDGRVAVPAARPDRPGPLSRGYVTYGVRGEPQGAIATGPATMSDAALEDLAHAAHKKAHDAAVALLRHRYGRAPERQYFVGSSEGGRAALAMAQRHPTDVDGVIARAPLVQWTGLQHARWRASLALQGEGWWRPAQVRWWADSVRLACDKLDGLEDRVIAAQEGCGHVFRAELLRCPEGAPAGDWCLGDAQLRAVQALLSSYRFDFALAHGVRSHPGWPIGGEDAAPAGPGGGWLAWWTGLRAPTVPPSADNGLAWQHAHAAIARWIVRDPAADLRRYEPGRYADRLRQVSALMDATDPDLSKFAVRGGRLLMFEPMADAARSPRAGMDYFESVVSRMGAKTVDGFARLYLAAGVDHVGGGAPSQVDLLDVMVDWVERGRAPERLQVVRQSASPPHAVEQTRPLCRWPMFPRYTGEGDPALAASFTCAGR